MSKVQEEPGLTRRMSDLKAIFLPRVESIGERRLKKAMTGEQLPGK